MSQEVSSSARFSRVRGTGRWGLAEVCRAGILMILMPRGGDAGGRGIYLPGTGPKMEIPA